MKNLLRIGTFEPGLFISGTVDQVTRSLVHVTPSPTPWKWPARVMLGTTADCVLRHKPVLHANRRRGTGSGEVQVQTTGGMLILANGQAWLDSKKLTPVPDTDYEIVEQSATRMKIQRLEFAVPPLVVVS